jgi:hypothetical protein
MPEYLNAEERRLRASIAGHASQAKHGSAKLLAAAHEANQTKFEDDVDPDRVLPPEERARRAKSARSAYMQQLSFRAVRARRAAAAEEAALKAQVASLTGNGGKQ